MILLLLLLCGSVSTARAEDHAFGPFKIEDANPDVIRLEGAIAIGTGLDFRRALMAAPSAKTLVLNSPGGLVAIALLIADDVYQRHLNTVVPANAGCFSACALIFFAGASRTVDGKLGVHQISSDTPDLTNAQLTISDIIDMLNRFGTPTDVLTTMFRTPASDIHIFTAEEIGRYGINRTSASQVQPTVKLPSQTVAASPPLTPDPLAKFLSGLPPAPTALSSPSSSPPSQPTPGSLAKLTDTPDVSESPDPTRDQQSTCKAFVEAYFADWSRENDVALPRMNSDYAPEISFFGKLTARAAVLEEKRKFAARWPTRSYTVRAGTMNVTVSPSGCTITGVVDWSASSEALHKSPRGSATFLFELKSSARPLILSESSAPLRTSGVAGETASAAGPQSASPSTGNVTLVTGQCEPASHTAEGPIGSDLTQRQSRFFCDSAVVNFFNNYKGHAMVQFAQRGAHHDRILGFAGTLDDAGVVMKVDHLYLEAGEATAINDGYCKFFFKARTLSGMACGAMVDETGRRTTAVVAFDADPGQ